MKILWTKSAKFHLTKLHEYISRDSKYYANVFALRIKKAVLRLEKFPESGRIIPEIGNENIREIVYGSYRIMYEIRGETVYITQIIHGSMDFNKEI